MRKYQPLPNLTEDEYAALVESIREHGYDPAHPVVVDEDGNILDGHHRDRAADECGISAPRVVLPGLTEEQKVEYALRANLQRRHLSQAQKRDLIRSELDRDPDRSDRAIGRLLGVDGKTVGTVRRGEVPHLVTDDDLLEETRQEAGRLQEVSDRAQAELEQYRSEHGHVSYDLLVAATRPLLDAMVAWGLLKGRLALHAEAQGHDLEQYAEDVGVELSEVWRHRDIAEAWTDADEDERVELRSQLLEAS